jgi:hypothetical protein
LSKTTLYREQNALPQLKKFPIGQWFGPLLAVLIGIVGFWLALLPIHTVETTLADYAGGKVEQADGSSYIWTTPNVRLIYRDVPRFAPIYLKLTVLLDRPPSTPPAHLEISEWRGNASLPLLTLDYSPAKSGYQEYTVKIPALSGDNSDELLLDLKANSFRVAGDSRELGIRIKSVTLSVSKGGLLQAVFTQPLFPALVILLLGLAWWGAMLRFGPLELTLLLAPVGFMTGGMANLLVYSGWWQLLDAVLLVGTAAAWWRWGQDWLATGWWRPLGLLMVGIAAFCGFFVLATGLPGDIYYWREVLAPTIQYGPIGTYQHAPRLVYPPGSVFQLYLYGLLTQPFNIAYNQSPLKLLMGSALLLIIPMLWWAGIKSGVRRVHIARTIMLFGLSLSLVFVPAVWVQADGWIFLMMGAALLLVVWKQPLASVGVQAFGIIYKAQSWLLLPLYALTFQWRFGWRKSVLYGVLGAALVLGFGGLGFAFDYNIFKLFWDQPVVSGESAWGGINSFNLLHLLGYDRITVPQPLLGLSYASVGLLYVGVLLVCWRRNAAIQRETSPDSPERAARSGAEWFLAAAVILSFIFFFWVKMHERYLYFGLAFVGLAALYRRDLYRPALLFNLLFCLNLLYAYIPERRDPVPNNFFFWRHFLHADPVQAALCLIGTAVCLWFGWLYFRPAPPLELVSSEE